MNDPGQIGKPTSFAHLATQKQVVYNFGGKTCLVFGGASGIGLAAAEAFRAAGASVIVADLSPGSDPWVKADVTSAADVRRAVAEAVRLGGGLDCAVNCAGVEGARAATAEYPEEAWHRVIAVNLTGVFHCMQAELEVMTKRGAGAIVNIASVAGLIGFTRHVAYTASKHGVIGITRTAALEYARAGTRVNAVCPGFTRTPMLERAWARRPELESRLSEAIPAGRFAETADVVPAILYLCSDAAAMVTGHCMVLDGGLTAA